MSKKIKKILTGAGAIAAVAGVAGGVGATMTNTTQTLPATKVVDYSSTGYAKGNLTQVNHSVRENGAARRDNVEQYFHVEANWGGYGNPYQNVTASADASNVWTNAWNTGQYSEEKHVVTGTLVIPDHLLVFNHENTPLYLHTKLANITVTGDNFDGVTYGAIGSDVYGSNPSMQNYESYAIKSIDYTVTLIKSALPGGFLFVTWIDMNVGSYFEIGAVTYVTR